MSCLSRLNTIHDMHLSSRKTKQRSCLSESNFTRKISKPKIEPFGSISQISKCERCSRTKKCEKSTKTTVKRDANKMPPRSKTFLEPHKSKSIKSVQFRSSVRISPSTTVASKRVNASNRETNNASKNVESSESSIQKLKQFIGIPEEPILLRKSNTWSMENNIQPKMSPKVIKFKTNSLTRSSDNLECAASKTTIKNTDSATALLKCPTASELFKRYYSQSYHLSDKLDAENRASLSKTAIGKRLLAGSVPKQDQSIEICRQIHSNKIDRNLQNLKSRVKLISRELEIVKMDLKTLETEKKDLEAAFNSSVYTEVY